MDNFSTLPEALFDNILQFTDVKDIVCFSNTTTEHNSFVKKITKNKQSKVSKLYEKTDICDIETWILSPSISFKLKFAKQYYDIYRNVGKYFELELDEVKHIFKSLFNLGKYIYKFDNNDKNNEKYKFVILTLFNFIKTNNHIFEGSFSNRTDEFNSRAFILDILFKLYGQDLKFIDYTELEEIFIDIYQEKINRLKTLPYPEKMDEFIVEYLEGWFYYTETENNFRNIGYIRELLEEMIINAGMGSLFLIPEDYDSNDSYGINTDLEPLTDNLII